MADNDLAALLAGAAKTNANFNFDEINKSYWSGLDEAYKRRTQDAFKDPSLYKEDGSLDPSKAFTKALQVGGLPAAEHIAKIADAANLQFLWGNARQNADTLAGRPNAAQPNQSAASPNAFPPSPSRDPAVVTEPKAPKTAPAQPQQQPSVFSQFLAAQGVPPDQQPAEAQKLQQGMLRMTGRPFDTSKPLNLNDPTTREVLKGYALTRAQSAQPAVQQGQAAQVPPPAPANPMIGPGGAQAGPAGGLTPPGAPGVVANRFMPGVGAPPPQAVQALPPQPPPQQAAVPPTGAPSAPAVLQPRPVQTTQVLPPSAAQADPTLGGIITPRELQLFGSPAGVLQYYEDRLRGGLPPTIAADAEKKVAAIREQLKYTETQKNAGAAGQTVADFIDKPERARQELAVLEKTYPVIIDGQKEAKGLRDNVVSIATARKQLDAPGGVVTGVWANERLKAMRIAALLGADLSQITNTETFNSEMSRRIQQMASSLPGQLSDKDVKFLSSIGGTSELSEKTLRTMLDVAEDYGRKKIRNHNEQVGELAKTNPAAARMKDFLSVKEPDPYRRALREGDIIRNDTNGKQYIIKNGRPAPYP